MKEHAVRWMIEARGLVFSDDYDGACFRRGKPGALSAGELGICLDCEDEITRFEDYGDDELFEKIADHFARGRWFVASGENASVRSPVPDFKEAATNVPLTIAHRRARHRTEARYRRPGS